MINKSYLPTKTIEKFGIALAEVLIAGTIVYLTENSLFLVIIPVLEAARNFLKHGLIK